MRLVPLCADLITDLQQIHQKLGFTPACSQDDSSESLLIVPLALVVSEFTREHVISQPNCAHVSKSAMFEFCNSKAGLTSRVFWGWGMWQRSASFGTLPTPIFYATPAMRYQTDSVGSRRKQNVSVVNHASALFRRRDGCKPDIHTM